MKSVSIKNSLIILLLLLFGVELIAQCPPSNLRKNGSCLIVSYASSGEASLALNAGESITVTNSGNSDGTYTASQICGTLDVVFTENGSSSCNCNGYNGSTAGTFVFQESGLTCVYDANGALPVTLENFTVVQKNSTLLLEWETSNEVNNEGFSLETASDGRRFNELDFIEGKGTSNALVKYRTIFDNPSSGLNYFRLKQIDFNGEYEYSDIISIPFRSKSTFDINFINDLQELRIHSEINIARLLIYDIKGQAVQKWSDVDGNSLLRVDKHAAGIYLASCHLENGEIANYRFAIY